MWHPGGELRTTDRARPITQVSSQSDVAGITKLVETAQSHSVVVDMFPYSKIIITPQAAGGTTNTDKGQPQDFSTVTNKIGDSKQKIYRWRSPRRSKLLAISQGNTYQQFLLKESVDRDKIRND
jgi:hypothetical protein